MYNESAYFWGRIYCFQKEERRKRFITKEAFICTVLAI